MDNSGYLLLAMHGELAFVATVGKSKKLGQLGEVTFTTRPEKALHVSFDEGRDIAYKYKAERLVLKRPDQVTLEGKEIYDPLFEKARGLLIEDHLWGAAHTWRPRKEVV